MTDIKEQIEHWFSPHSPAPDRAAKFQRLSDHGKAFALLLVDVCPPGQERDWAIRRLREAIWIAASTITSTASPQVPDPERVSVDPKLLQQCLDALIDQSSNAPLCSHEPDECTCQHESKLAYLRHEIRNALYAYEMRKAVHKS